MFVRSVFDIIRSRFSRPLNRRMRRASAQLQCLESLEGRQLLTFNLAVNYAVGTGPLDIVTADFNGDGRLDIATANHDSHNVSVLLGNANGTFQPAKNSPTGNNPLSVAVGDFNADGKLDIATANVGDVSVLLGNGTGTFQAPVNIGFSDGSSPSSVAVGDFNGDGRLDLGVTSNIYYPGYSGYYSWSPPSYAGRANILLGTGGGSFAPPSSSTGYGYFTSAVLEDFNADGKVDFASVAIDTYSTTSSVQIILGTETGVPGAPAYSSGSYTARSVAAGDVNGDGMLDLVTPNQYSPNVGVHLGTGTGSFGTAVLYDTGMYSTSIAFSDFNGDSRTDLLAANPIDSAISVLLGTGTGDFRPPLSTATAANTFALAVGDFNGDGRADAASANVSVLLNDGVWIPLDAPLMTINSVTVTEGNTGTTAATFTVSLSVASSQTVTVNYATANGTANAGSDYQSKSGTLTFTPGQTTKTISAAITGDRAVEDSETFSVRLTSATNAIVTSGTGVATILDDEPLISLGGEVSAAEGNTGTTPFLFTVFLSTAYDAPVTVNYATSDLSDYWINEVGYESATAGVDYVAKSGTLTFAAGQTSQTITVLVNGDRLVESTEYFEVNLSGPGIGKLYGSQALGSVQDEEPSVILSSSSVVEGNTGTTVLNFTVDLWPAYDAPVTVAFVTSDGSAVAGSDYTAASGTVTFAAGQTSLAIPVSVRSDLLAETDEYFTMQLSDASSARIDSAFAFGTIFDDDRPPSVHISGDAIYEGQSGTQLLTFTVSLSQVSSKTVKVNYATANGTALSGDRDYVAKSGTLTFAPGETTKTISVVVNGDKKKEKDEYFYVKLSSPINSTIGTSRASGSIWNDDGGTAGRSRLSFSRDLDEIFEDLLTGRPKKRRR